MSWQHEIIAHLQSVYDLLLRNADSELEPLDETRFNVQQVLEDVQNMKQDILCMFPTKPYDIEPPPTIVYRRDS